MLLIFCGDHTVASRDALSRHKQSLPGRAIKTVDVSEIVEVIKSGGSAALDLFSGAPVYETIGLVGMFKKKYARKAKEELRRLVEDANIELLDWEEKSAYDMGLDKEKGGWVHESKMSESTFTLLPSLVPGKAGIFLQKLETLTQYQPIEVTYIMLQRHVRMMLTLADGGYPKDNPFLVRLAQSSARAWTVDKLTRLYQQLLKIDANVKTGSNTPLSLRQQLEITISMML